MYDQRPGSSQEVVPSARLHLELSGSYGLGYRNASDPRFRMIAAYLGKKVDAWRERGLPILAAELLALMGRDSGAFLRQVCVTAAGPSTYARLPVLKTIAPDDFVMAFAAQDAEGRKDSLMALSIRYEHLSIDKSVATESAWLREVYDRLTAYVDGLDPIPRAVLSGRIEHFLGNVVSKIKVPVAAAPLDQQSASPGPDLK